MEPRNPLQQPVQPPIAPTPPQPPILPYTPKSQNTSLFLIGIILLLASLGSFGIFAYQNYFTQKPLPTVSPTPPTSTPDETANWKTYTNSQAGFSIKYPADVFVYQGNPQQESQFWSNKINGGAPLELGQDGIWLNMSFSNPGAIMTDFYNKIINLRINETISQSAITKLANINSDGVAGATYHQGIPPDFTGEPAYTYEAVWIKGNLVYRLSLSAFTESNLQTYKTTFDQILSTFKFLDHTCPVNGWENCMPILSENAKKECTPEAIEWKKKNCPNFQGTAY